MAERLNTVRGFVNTENMLASWPLAENDATVSIHEDVLNGGKLRGYFIVF